MGPSRHRLGMASAALPGRNEPSWGHPRGGGPAGGGGSKKAGGNGGKMSKTQTPNPNFMSKKKLQSNAHSTYEINDESPPAVKTSIDAASSANRQSGDDFVHSQYLSFDISSRSRNELSELRTRLISELEQIRQLRDRIESGKLSGRSGQNVPPQMKPIDGKKMSGSKRPLPPNFGQDTKRSHNSEIGDNRNSMKSCALILTKLMKHKHAWIFKTPVDVVTLQLHDYYNIVKNPMDLGTVKMKLTRNLYTSPLDFAHDVKLTFSNAMLYNPKGHDVYLMAEQLHARFEELFQPMYKKIEDEQPGKFDEEQQQGRVYNEQRLDRGYDEQRQDRGYAEQRQEQVYEQRQDQVDDEELASSWSNVEPERPRKDELVPTGMKSDQTLSQQPRSQSPVQTPEPMRAALVKPVKQPKPKAKDPNKREMTLEEKHKLGIGLQSLPQEKMENVVQIISKRNGHLRHDGDEIELDIEAVDTETLWELDRFVTNWKKMMSKIKRQGLITNAGSGSVEHIGEELEIEHIDFEVGARRDAGDEDVDIGDDMPMSSYAPVVIEKDDGAAGATGGCASSSSSGSSSSGSGSSSSSGSDSGSSSGSDSEADNAQS